MGRLFKFDGARLRDQFNTIPHQFEHCIDEYEFNISTLAAAAPVLYGLGGKAKVYCMQSAALVNQGFNANIAGDVDLERVISEIEVNRSWIVLKDLQLIPAFREIFEGTVRDFAEEISEFRSPRLHEVRAYAFVSSPGTLTPYHIDGEWSLLAQVKGRKFYRIFDVRDPNVISSEEIESFYCGDFDAAKYREASEASAQEFSLEPGLALSQPRHAPHIVRVDPTGGYSITFGLSLLTKQWAADKSVHLANAFLRRQGLRPDLLGRRPAIDLVKGVGYRAARRIGEAMNPAARARLSNPA